MQICSMCPEDLNKYNCAFQMNYYELGTETPEQLAAVNINENFNRLITLTTKIALQDINIEYVITLNNKIILGKDFLEEVKPWKINQDYFEFTYNQNQYKTKIINE